MKTFAVALLVLAASCAASPAHHGGKHQRRSINDLLFTALNSQGAVGGAVPKITGDSPLGPFLQNLISQNGQVGQLLGTVVGPQSVTGPALDGITSTLGLNPVVQGLQVLLSTPILNQFLQVVNNIVAKLLGPILGLGTNGLIGNSPLNPLLSAILPGLLPSVTTGLQPLLQGLDPLLGGLLNGLNGGLLSGLAAGPRA